MSTSLSTLKSALTLKSTFLSGSTLTSALLGTFRRALGPPEPTSLVDKDGWSPLHRAAANNQVEAIDALLKAGANVNQLSKSQAPPLWFAAANNHREAVTALLDAGADPHLGLSPLDIGGVKDEMKKFIRERASKSK